MTAVKFKEYSLWCIYLSSVNLLGKFSSVEAQDDMLREIIRSEIQMNLAELQENENREADNSK